MMLGVPFLAWKERIPELNEFGLREITKATTLDAERTAGKPNVCFWSRHTGKRTHYEIWLGSFRPVLPFNERLPNGVT